MKENLGLLFVIIGSRIFRIGFGMLTPHLRKMFAKELYDTANTFLDKDAQRNK